MELAKRTDVMGNKGTGLAAFTRKGTVVNSDSASVESKPSIEASSISSTAGRARGRGKGEKVALTVRLSRADWERVHQLAVSEGVSIQTLAVEGLSKIFMEKGLPKLSE